MDFTSRINSISGINWSCDWLYGSSSRRKWFGKSFGFVITFEVSYFVPIIQQLNNYYSCNRFIIDALTGQDVSRKLYAVSDIANMSAQREKEMNPKGVPDRKTHRVLDFRRTASVDAIHTGGKGHVRSGQWIRDANLKHFQTGDQSFLLLCLPLCRDKVIT